MKKSFIFIFAILAFLISCNQKTEKALEVDISNHPKMLTSFANPLVDFNYNADPTCVEYEGRLYVYGTNDEQQALETHPDSSNTYEHINSLTMLSTDDMVNWQFHGFIQTKKIAPWIIASWAPSVISRKESDNKTHFYLYFSNSGFGSGVITATNPIGPWTSPLDKSLVDANTPNLGSCNVPFDPGAVIDENGVGWIAFGAGRSRIAKLGSDLISIASDFVNPSPTAHFEANELNYINGTYIYTYNTDWQKRDNWPFKDSATLCGMSYMTSKTPLDSSSWIYQHQYTKNPGDCGFDFTNNHTHIHKYKDQWYIFYHRMDLHHYRGDKGGYRNMCVDYLEVDTTIPSIMPKDYTKEGVKQIKNFDPYQENPFSISFATIGVKYNEDEQGLVLSASPKDVAAIMIKGVDFSEKCNSIEISFLGDGQIDIRKGNPNGELLASQFVSNNNKTITKQKIKLDKSISNINDLSFVFSGETLELYSWKAIK